MVSEGDGVVHDDLVDGRIDLAKSDDWATPKYALATFGVLFSMHFLDYLDRNLLTSILPQIRKDMPTLSNDQWGLLTTIFLVSYSVISPAMGWLGDRYRRNRLLAVGIGIWSLATVGTGLARDFGHLALARSFLGIGEATYGVIAPTILIDLFSRQTRSRLMSAFYLAMPIGAAAGILLGPVLANAIGWHRSFFLVGIPGFAAAILVLFLPEPVRGASEAIDPDRLKKHESAGTTKADYVDLMVNSSYTYSVFGQAAYTFAIGGMLIWVPNYLFNTRQFDQVQAGLILGGVTLGAALSGMIAGGRLSDSLAKRRPGMMFVVPGVAMLLSIPFVVAAMLSRSPWIIYPCIFMAEALMFVNTGPCTAIIANVVQPNLRAAAFAISTFAVHFLGDIWSPWLIAKASTLCADAETMATPFGKVLASIGAVPTQQGTAPPENLVAGLLCITPALLLSGIVLLAGARHLPREMELMRAKLKAAPVNP